MIQAQVDGGQRQGATSEELAEIKESKAKVRRLVQRHLPPWTEQNVVGRSGLCGHGSSSAGWGCAAHVYVTSRTHP